MLDFKIKRLDNIRINFVDLQEYYAMVQQEFQGLKWTVPSNINTMTHSVSNMYSWAVQSNLIDPTVPCPPYHIDGIEGVSEADDFSVPTDLIFGFAQRLIRALPNIRQTAITGHPSKTKIDLHPDNDNFLKIHIPIVTNPDAWFFFEDEKFNLEAGSVYMVNTALPHGTENLGSTDRVHMMCKFPYSDAQNILNGNYTI
jgi:hypothetical protein